MQKCYYRSENDYFQVEQFTSRSFMVRSIFHISSWTQHNNVPVPKSMETVQENRSWQNTTCALFSNNTAHFHRRTFSYQSSEYYCCFSLIWTNWSSLRSGTRKHFKIRKINLQLQKEENWIETKTFCRKSTTNQTVISLRESRDLILAQVVLIYFRKTL